MAGPFTDPQHAFRAFTNGEVGREALTMIIDGLLAEGTTVEELTATVQAAHGEGAFDAAEVMQLTALITAAARAGAPVEAEAQRIEPGTRLLDRFIIDELLGHGGMGMVYSARDALKLEARDRHPRLAVKVLNDVFARRPEAFLALQREASRQQRLAHPNIATVFDFYRDGGTLFITMELLEGRTLDELLRQEVAPRGGLTLLEALPMIEGMCAALGHAHRQGFVHADFKPGNCFLTTDGRLKVLDFGIARAIQLTNAQTDDRTLFDSRQIGALTPAYASPEMFDNSAEPDPRDDVYALGCVTCELLTGRHPFHRLTARDAREQGLQPPRVPGLSRRQNRTLSAALAFDRGARVATTESFLEGMRDLRVRSRRQAVLISAAVGALLVLAALQLLDRPPPPETAVPQTASPEPAAGWLAVHPPGAATYLDGRPVDPRGLARPAAGQLAVVAPGHVGVLDDVASLESGESVVLAPLGRPAKREHDRFAGAFFGGGDVAEALSGVRHPPLRALLELKELRLGLFEAELERRGQAFTTLARLGDQGAALVVFVARDGGLIEADPGASLGWLRAAMDGGYPLASFYYALHLKDRAGSEMVRSSPEHQQYEAALTLATSQGLDDIVAAFRRDSVR